MFNGTSKVILLSLLVGLSLAGEFKIKLDGTWKNVCCKSGKPEVTNEDCDWNHAKRRLEDKDNKSLLDCPENGQKPVKCTCSNTGEKFHGIFGPVASSIGQPDGAPIFPNSGKQVCVYVDNKGEFRTKYVFDANTAVKKSKDTNNWKNDKWADDKCPHFKLEGFRKARTTKFNEGNWWDDSADIDSTDDDVQLGSSGSVSPSILLAPLLVSLWYAIAAIQK